MRKQLLLIPLILFTFAALALATPPWTTTLIAPAEDGTVLGSYTLNATMASTDFVNLTTEWYCEFYASSTLTANSSYTVGTTTGLLVNQTNDTAKWFIDVAWDSADTPFTLEDDSTYVFSANCGMANGTDIQDEDTSTGVTVDNSEPTAPSSLYPTEGAIYNYTGVTFIGTVAEENTSSCTLYFVGNNPGTSSYAGTQTAGTATCTKSFNTNYFAEGVYMYYMRASDGTNTSDSVKTNFTVDTPGGMGFSQQQIEALKEANLKALGKIAISPVLMIAIVIVGYLVLVRKKKR